MVRSSTAPAASRSTRTSPDMRALLAETAVLGVTTNLGFLRWALDQPAFRAGEAGTDFVEREWSAALVPELPEEVRLAALAHMM